MAIDDHARLAQQPVQVAPENIFAFLRRAFGRKNFTHSALHRYIRREKQAPGPQRPHRPLNRIVLQHAAARVDTHVRTVAPAFDCPFPATAALAVIEEEEDYPEEEGTEDLSEQLQGD